MTLDDALERHLAHAAFRLRLDEALGPWHGLSWDDFVLLAVLEAAGGRIASPVLASRLGLVRSGLLQRLLPLEKIGVLVREQDDDGTRLVVLRPAGLQLVQDARRTATAACGRVNAR
jgi:DNA-binding MarR family transcriptional regulator